MKKNITLVLLSLTIMVFCMSQKAGALTYQRDWGGLTVAITYPNKVIFNTAFGISFNVDSSTMVTPDAAAFLSTLSVSNTVDVSGVTWGYSFISDDPLWNFNYSGTLGDTKAPYVRLADGSYSINLSDPLLSTAPYTWLWNSFNDQVTWTLNNFIIKGDTTFSLRLDDLNIGPGPIEPGFIVLDPPAVEASVPEPSILYLMLAGVLAMSIFLRYINRRALSHR